jgi:flagellar biosynthesis protein FlhB
MNVPKRLSKLIVNILLFLLAKYIFFDIGSDEFRNIFLSPGLTSLEIFWLTYKKAFLTTVLTGLLIYIFDL